LVKVDTMENRGKAEGAAKARSRLLTASNKPQTKEDESVTYS
jgi:hypothetical protein